MKFRVCTCNYVFERDVVCEYMKDAGKESCWCGKVIRIFGVKEE
jgi:hypothetical protein